MTTRPQLTLAFADGLVEIRSDYHELVVDGMRSLPGAHYDADDRVWRLRAAREALTAVAVWLREAGDTINVRCDREARRRLDNCSPAWVTACREGIIVAGPYNAPRVRLLRAVPEAVYEPRRQRWVVAVTRASAAALLHAIDVGGWRFEADARTRRLLELVREGAPYEPLRLDRGPAEPGRRRSPVPHWRHYLRGAVFEANRDRREFVDGIGWCVRVRVDPTANP